MGNLDYPLWQQPYQAALLESLTPKKVQTLSVRLKMPFCSGSKNSQEVPMARLNDLQSMTLFEH